MFLGAELPGGKKSFWWWC